MQYMAQNESWETFRLNRGSCPEASVGRLQVNEPEEPIVFLHGLFAHSRQYRAALSVAQEELRTTHGRNVPIYALNVPPSESRGTVLNETLEQFQIDTAMLVTHSAGIKILEDISGETNGRIRNLLAFQPAGLEFPGNSLQLVLRCLRESGVILRDLSQGKSEGGGISHVVDAVRGALWYLGNPKTAGGEFWSVTKFNAKPGIASLLEKDIPVDVVLADDDRIFDPQKSKRYLEDLPGDHSQLSVHTCAGSHVALAVNGPSSAAHIVRAYLQHSGS